MKRITFLLGALLLTAMLTGCAGQEPVGVQVVKRDGAKVITETYTITGNIPLPQIQVVTAPVAPAATTVSAPTAPVLASTPVPAAPAAPTGPLGMKYQYDDGCAATTSPMNYPACVFQRVQAGELTAEQAVVTIQALGQKFGAPSFEGMNLTLPNQQPAIVWCPAGGIFPPDTARPLEGTSGARWASNLVVIDAGTGGPDRVIKATGSACWLVYVR